MRTLSRGLVALASSITLIALGSYASAVTIFTPQPVFSITGSANAIAFNASGSTAYIANGSGCVVQVVNTRTNVVTDTVPISCGQADAIVDMNMMPNGSALWVATDKKIYSINPSTLVVSVAVDESSNPAAHLGQFSFSVDSSTAYVSNLTNAVHAFATASGLQGCTYGLTSGNTVSADISPDGTRLAVTTTGPGSSVVIFEMASIGCYLGRWSSSVTGTTRSTVWASDSSQVYVAYGISTNPPSNFGVRKVDRNNNSGTTITTAAMPYSLSLSPDGSTILMAQADSTFGLIDVASGTVTTQALSTYADGVVAAFNPTGSSV